MKFWLWTPPLPTPIRKLHRREKYYTLRAVIVGEGDLCIFGVNILCEYLGVDVDDSFQNLSLANWDPSFLVTI